MLYRSGWAASSRPRPLALPGLFITGTDTEVGKTHVACCIARWLIGQGLRVGAYKPVATGGVPAGERLPPESDPGRLWEAIQHHGSPERITPQWFALPAAPPVAAAAEGREIDEPLLLRGALWWQRRCDFLVVEGVGGWFSPLSWQMTVADVAVLLGLPVVLVVPDRLGAVNQTLSTLHAVAGYGPGCPVAAVVLNQAGPRSAETDAADNYTQLRAWCPRVPVLRMAHQAQDFSPPVDWRELGN